MPLIYLNEYQQPAVPFASTLFAWGLNTSGQLGDITTANKSSPIPVPSGSWAAVSTYGNHTLALKPNGTLWAWGDNSFGQLGTGTIINRSSPVQIGTSSWSAIGTGAFHSLAIRADFIGQTLYAWGLNSSGQVGDSTIINRSSPVLVSGNIFRMCAGGLSHSAAIRNDGRLFVFGGNSVGQLGDGTIINRSAPVTIGLSSWTSIGLGNQHTGAVTRLGSPTVETGGNLFMWGANSSGQLGDSTIINKSSPVQIGAGFWWTVDGGQDYTVARTSGSRIFAWGSNASGELGLNDTVNRSSPVQIGSLPVWTDIVASGNHSSAGGFTLALHYDGSKWAWGRNTTGEFADGTTGSTRSSPVQVGTAEWQPVTIPILFPDLTKDKRRVTDAGSSHAVGIRGVASTLFGWGSGGGGVLGDGTGTNRGSPVLISVGSWAAVTGGTSHALGIKPDGSLWAWGDNALGQLGLNLPTQFVYSPVQVGTSSWTTIASGQTHSLAIRIDGALFTWGRNLSGELGHGDAISRSSPIQVGTSNWSVISGGNGTSGGITTDGALFMWGAAGSGRLGDGFVISRSSPVQIGTSSWSAVTAGGRRHTLAIRIDGLLFAWGDNQLGQYGSGAAGFATNRSSPTLIGAPVSSWSAVKAGADYTIGIRSTGELFSWGYNAVGSLGDGTVISRSSPVQIGSETWIAIATAHSQGDNLPDNNSGSTLALRSNNTLWTWGPGNLGQLGDNNLANRSSPIQVGTLSWSALPNNLGQAHDHAIRL
jgi:alpha-tubulin suppressor-like RCC1 family protein